MLGIEPTLISVAVMLGASAAFIMPIGYQVRRVVRRSVCDDRARAVVYLVCVVCHESAV